MPRDPVGSEHEPRTSEPRASGTQDSSSADKFGVDKSPIDRRDATEVGGKTRDKADINASHGSRLGAPLFDENNPNQNTEVPGPNQPRGSGVRTDPKAGTPNR